MSSPRRTFATADKLRRNRVALRKTFLYHAGEEGKNIFKSGFTESGAIGYGYCFSGKVVGVHKGSTGDADILMTVTADGDKYYKILSSADEDKVLRISFIWNRDNEKYSTTFVTGFVDSKMTSWKIVSIDVPE
ncbi:MAG: hypothetical protein PHN88_07350 [Ignavibacteria bacterium]|nr:hypothetical protein [Ignavibacteria bacterium]